MLVGLSVGIALFPADGADGASLLKNADTALYRAKADGRGTFRTFEPEMNARLHARRALESDLREAHRAAPARGSLPAAGRPRAPPDHRFRGPGPVAASRARHGLARGVHPARRGDRADRAARRVGPAHRLRDRRPMAGASSESASTCRRSSSARCDLPALIADVLAAHRLRPDRLELEITEGVLVKDVEQALATLRQIKTLGVRFAMDDFGTGYSSLSYLQRFPFDKIKIDALVHRSDAGQRGIGRDRARRDRPRAQPQHPGDRRRGGDGRAAAPAARASSATRSRAI